MLNPSTADAEIDDPTIRKLKGFTADWGYKSFIVGNLYAARATNPKDLQNFDDPVGPENDAMLSFLSHHRLIVAAWGKLPNPRRVAQVVDILTRNGSQLYCLGTNLDGSPKHPLYVPYSQRLQLWPTT